MLWDSASGDVPRNSLISSEQILGWLIAIELNSCYLRGNGTSSAFNHPAEFDFRLPTVKIVTDSVTQRPLLRTNRAPSGRGRHTGSDSGFNAMLPLNSL